MHLLSTMFKNICEHNLLVLNQGFSTDCEQGTTNLTKNYHHMGTTVVLGGNMDFLFVIFLLMVVNSC